MVLTGRSLYIIYKYEALGAICHIIMNSLILQLYSQPAESSTEIAPCDAL